jgi:hypothetical protein
MAPPQPADDKILPSSLLWTCRNNQHRPLWTSQPHSAASLHDKVTKSVALFSPDRYDTKPFYRQIPIDGVNAKSTLTVHYSSQHEQEDVIITTKTAPISIPNSTSNPNQTFAPHSLCLSIFSTDLCSTFMIYVVTSFRRRIMRSTETHIHSTNEILHLQNTPLKYPFNFLKGFMAKKG